MSLKTDRILVIAICHAMAVCAWGTVFYGHSVYMDALTQSRGWTSGMISGAMVVFWIASPIRQTAAQKYCC